MSAIYLKCLPLLCAGFLAALGAGFLAPAAALLVLELAGVFAAPAFLVVIFFDDAEAGFAFRLAAAFRLLAAPIAAPASAPITVPTTGSPRAVPATGARDCATQIAPSRAGGLINRILFLFVVHVPSTKS